MRLELSLLVLCTLLVICSASRPKAIQARNVSPIFTTPDQLLERELSSPQSLSSRRGFMSGRGKGQESQTSFNKIKQRGRVSKWSQTIEGIRVYGSVITTNSDKFGRINKIQGFLGSKNSLLDTRPKFSAADTLSALKRRWNHDRLRDVDWRIDDAELQILPSDDGFDKLVWKLSYYVDWKDGVRPRNGFGPVPAYIIGLVNAHTRLVERTWNGLQHIEPKTTHTTTVRAIVGNKKIGKEYHDITVEREGWYCWHQDNNRRVEVFDIWNKRYLSNYTRSKFVCPRAENEDWDLVDWTGGYSPRNEAHLYGGHFVDMWREIIGNDIQPYRTNDSKLLLYTHYGYQYQNAFFNGYSFVFGDGKDLTYPLTALDIVCHEIGHAITEWHGGFMEYWMEPGAINEAYSDILGETCDIHYKQKSNTLLGEDIVKPGNISIDAMRDMCNPKRLGAIDHYSQYTDNLDVHNSSGVYNKAWCLLKNTAGWNYIMAFEVFTDANLLYWAPMVSMNCGACGVETAAESRGYSKTAVTEAFTAVGVSCAFCV